jgi:hypothetical protein
VDTDGFQIQRGKRRNAALSTQRVQHPEEEEKQTPRKKATTAKQIVVEDGDMKQ